MIETKMTESEIMRALLDWSERGMAFCNVGMPEFARNILALLKDKKEEENAMTAHIACLKEELCHKDEKIKRLIDEDSTKKRTIQTIVRTTPGTFMCDFDDNAGKLLECFNLGFKVVMVQPWFDEKGRPMGNEYVLEAERKVRKDGDNNDKL